LQLEKGNKKYYYSSIRLGKARSNYEREIPWRRIPSNMKRLNEVWKGISNEINKNLSL